MDSQHGPASGGSRTASGGGRSLPGVEAGPYSPENSYGRPARTPQKPPGGEAATPTERTELTLCSRRTRAQRPPRPPPAGEELRIRHLKRLSRMLCEMWGRVEKRPSDGVSVRNKHEILEPNPPYLWASVLSPQVPFPLL